MMDLNWKRDFIEQGEAESERIATLELQGHTAHCARRIVWGDGECECGRDADVYFAELEASFHPGRPGV